MTRKIKLNWETKPRPRRSQDILDDIRRRMLLNTERGRISSYIPVPDGMRPRLSRSRPRKDKKIRKFWSSFKNWVMGKTIKNEVVSPSEIETARKQLYEEIYGVNPLEWNEDIPDTFTSPIPTEAPDEINEINLNIDRQRQQRLTSLKNSLNKIERDCQQFVPMRW